MRAPQYPKGLRLEAFGSGMVGDVRELNIINHYVGMPPIDPAPALETAVFPIALTVVIALCLLSPLHRWARRARAHGRCRHAHRHPHRRAVVALPLRPQPRSQSAHSSRAVHAARHGVVEARQLHHLVFDLLGRGVPARRRRCSRAGRTPEPAPRDRFAGERRGAPDAGGVHRRPLLAHRPRRGPAGHRVRSDAGAAGTAGRRAARQHRHRRRRRPPWSDRRPRSAHRRGGERRRHRRRRRGQRGHDRRRRRRLSRLHRAQQRPAGDRGSGGHQGHRQRTS